MCRKETKRNKRYIKLPLKKKKRQKNYNLFTVLNFFPPYPDNIVRNEKVRKEMELRKTEKKRRNKLTINVNVNVRN